MYPWRTRIATCLLAACCGVTAVAVDPARSDDEKERVEVSAEDAIEVRGAGDTIEATGNVEIRRRGTVFGADSVEFDRSRRTLRARGSVYLRDPRYRLQASGLEMDLADETGTILDADVFIEDGNLSLGGSRVEKFTGQTYAAQDGRLTTCLCEGDGTPPWRIGAREIRLGEDGRAAADDVTFYVYDVPVLYLPYATFPSVAERATGVLSPSFGWSDRAGLRYRQPFFWAVDESNDATVNLALESRSRAGVTGQYRAVLDARTAGRLDLAYFNERTHGVRSVEDERIADATVPADRWSVRLTHRHRAPSGWATFSDAALYSDSLVTRELMDFTDLDAGERRRARVSRSSPSRLGFYWHQSGSLPLPLGEGRGEGSVTLRGELDYLQDLVQPQRQALHRIPHIAFSGSRRLGSGLDLGWDATVTRYVRERLADGLRIDIRPELTWPVTLGRHFRLASSVALRETLYRLDSVEGRFAAARDDHSAQFARNSSRELVEFRSTLSTSLSRVYDGKLGPWSRFRHVVEPAVRYVFIPSTDQRHLPLWDGVDRINRRNLLALSLTNRFWAKRGSDVPAVANDPAAGDRGGGGGPAIVTRVARARVAASLDLDKARKGSGRLSDLDIGLGVHPADNVDVVVGLGIDPGPWNLREAALGFSLFEAAPPDIRVPDRDFRRPNGLSLSYRHIRANPLSPLADHANLDLLSDCPTDPRCLERGPLDAVHASAVLRVADRLLLLYDGNYDGASGRLTRNEIGMKYLSRCRCWTVAAFVDLQTNPDRTLLSVKFNLLGLGS